ncbi:MAG: DUF2764 family protein [Bacteroidales bacterium]|nr:DUF2764 family protein [Bacteroidales bacterium]
MSKYYCLIAGLPEINLEDQKLAFTVKEFKDEVYCQLDKKDRKLIDLFFLKYDNNNLISYLDNKEAVLDERATLKAEELEEFIKAIKEDDKMGYSNFVPYFNKFISQYLANQAPTSEILWKDVLSALYYQYALKADNCFIARWFEYCLNINNILIAHSARKYHFDASDFIVGSNKIAQALRTSSSRDWGLSGEIDYLETVQRIADEENLVEREKKIDLLKWQWLDEQTFFHYFTIEPIFAYLLRIEMVERWLSLNKETGEKKLRDMIGRLKSEVKQPEDFQ